MFKYSKLAICSSDWHLTAAKPVNRKKGYSQQQFEKVSWILDQCIKYKADLYLAGDVFDRAREPRWLVNKYQELFVKKGVTIIACAGQHDQAYHSQDLSDTSINSFYSSGLIHHTAEAVDWGATMPIDSKVIIAHYCVTEKPNPFISYSVTASEFMKKVASELIVTGDYHPAHYLEKDGRLLLNPGSIMRNASDSMSKEPSVYLVDVEEVELIDTLSIPILRPADVFDMESIQRHKESKKRKEEMQERFDEYINNAASSKLRPDFPKNVLKVIQDVKPEETVKQEIDSIMEVV